MNDPLVNVWIITETEGAIISAHCSGCKAELAESCSHVACTSTSNAGYVHKQKVRTNIAIRTEIAVKLTYKVEREPSLKPYSGVFFLVYDS